MGGCYFRGEGIRSDRGECKQLSPGYAHHKTHAGREQMAKYTSLILHLSEQPTNKILWHLLAIQLADDEFLAEAAWIKRDWHMLGSLASGTFENIRTACVEARQVSPQAAEIIDELVALIQWQRNRIIRQLPALPRS